MCQTYCRYSYNIQYSYVHKIHIHSRVIPAAKSETGSMCVYADIQIIFLGQCMSLEGIQVFLYIPIIVFVGQFNPTICDIWLVKEVGRQCIPIQCLIKIDFTFHFSCIWLDRDNSEADVSPIHITQPYLTLLYTFKFEFEGSFN